MMPYFTYEITDRAGRRVRGEGRFASVEELFRAVRTRGGNLVRYRQRLLPPLPRMRRKLQRPVLSEFFRNLALLIRGGVPLRDAIEDMVKPPCHPGLSELFAKVGRHIDDGLLFSEAIRASGTKIPQILLPLIAIGEETGRLDRTLRDGADHLDRVERIISSTRRALVYPTVVLVSMLAALSFWMIFVLPQLLDMFRTMGITELPLATRILIRSIDLFATWWPVLPALVALFFLFYLLARKSATIHYWWDQFWIHVPLIKTIIRSSQLAFFFEYTSMLTASGVNILRSLELMEESVRNQILKRAVVFIRQQIGDGHAMSDAIGSLGFFEPFVLRMVRVGEQTGDMPEQLHLLAGYYMDKVDKLVAALSKTLEPVIIAMAGVIFAIIALGLLGPVYTMISQIS